MTVSSAAAAVPFSGIRIRRRDAEVGILTVTGADRLSFLTRIMSGDLPRAAGAARTALLSPKGHLVAAGIATVLPDTVLLEGEAGRAEVLLRALDRYRIADAVEIGAAAADRGLLAVEGLEAASLLDPILGTPDSAGTASKVSGLAPGAVLVLDSGFVRREFRPWPAFLLGGPRRWTRKLAVALDAAGVVQGGAEEADYLRIAAGEPGWGTELNERSLPLGSGLAAHVRLGKGCYIGQEYVARQAHRGRVPRLLRRLDLEGAALPSSGAPVRLPDRPEERPVGRITSAAAPPAGFHGPALALAIVSADVRPEARVLVEGDGGAPLAARVRALS